MTQQNRQQTDSNGNPSCMDLHHVTEVHNQGVEFRLHVKPLIIGADLKSADFILVQNGKYRAVSVDIYAPCPQLLCLEATRVAMNS